MIRFLDPAIVRRVTGQSVVLVGISIVAGLLTLDRARLPADLAQSFTASQKQVATVSLEQVRDGIAAGSMLCIDARSTPEFEKGHVRKPEGSGMNGTNLTRFWEDSCGGKLVSNPGLAG